MASRTLDIPGNGDYVTVSVRTQDNLPSHIRGSAYWQLYGTLHPRNSYCVPSALEGDDLPVEFINNQWYHLVWLTAQREYQTRHDFDITYPENSLGLGWWQITDPAHPEYQKPSPIEFRTTFSQGLISSGAQRASTQDNEASVTADVSLRVDRIASNLAKDLELGRDTSILKPAPRMSPSIPTMSLHALADAIDAAATAVPPPVYALQHPLGLTHNVMPFVEGQYADPPDDPPIQIASMVATAITTAMPTSALQQWAQSGGGGGRGNGGRGSRSRGGGGGGGGGGGPPGRQPPAAPVAVVPAAPNNGRGLIGKEPTVFDGV